MLKREENMIKSGTTLSLQQMIAYEQRMKVGAMLNPLALNRQLLEGQEIGGLVWPQITNK
jgi:hypothetical protein